MADEAAPGASPVVAATAWRADRTSRWLGTARTLWPGTALCAVIGLAATSVSSLHGGPQLLYALLFGMALHGFGAEARAEAGIEFCARFVLRLGVALLGARITAEQMLALGWATAGMVVGAVVLTIAGGIGLARLLKLPTRLGLLSGVATAICGASAALAVASVLPRSREQDRATLLVVVCVTTLSTLAMLIYPLIAKLLHLTPATAGLFLGATIHDVAQVVGAGYTLDPAAGDAAVIVKLFRVSLLALVVIAITAMLRSRGPAADEPGAPAAPWLPWFLQLFIVLVVLNSMHGIPAVLQTAMSGTSRACLVLAIAALGLKTALRSLADAGWRPLVLLVGETLWLAAMVLGFVAWVSWAGV
jgi:uncharacterized integral membrane protein (TIGR00698 family)